MGRVCRRERAATAVAYLLLYKFVFIVVDVAKILRL